MINTHKLKFITSMYNFIILAFFLLILLFSRCFRRNLATEVTKKKIA